VTNRIPAEVFPPGKVLQEELETRGWSQVDLAAILGRPPRLVNEIIKGKRAITPETAHGLGEALETGPELWMNLESAYQLSVVRIERTSIGKRAQIFGRFPVREMQRRGWIPVTSSVNTLERNLLTFFGIDSLDSELGVAHAAKRTSYGKITAQQAAWLSRVRYLASNLKVDKYVEEDLRKLYPKLRSFAERLEDLRHIPAVLSTIGIRLVIVEPLPGSKIDGACLWLSDMEPVVALSLRYDKHDMCCHALFHELDHVENREGQSAPMLDIDLVALDVEDSVRPIEERANNNAAERLIPKKELHAFVTQANNSYSEFLILSFAKKMKIHPGIVVGQLQHQGLIPWSSYNYLKAKVRNVITETALTDGFGKLVG